MLQSAGSTRRVAEDKYSEARVAGVVDVHIFQARCIVRHGCQLLFRQAAGDALQQHIHGAPAQRLLSAPLMLQALHTVSPTASCMKQSGRHYATVAWKVWGECMHRPQL